MPIRLAEFADIPQLIEFARRYFEAEGRSPDLDALAAFYTGHLVSEDAVCFVSTKRGDDTTLNGFICGAVGNHVLHGERCASLTKWYAEPGAGGYGAQLFARLEAWARSKGVSKLYVTGRQPRTLEYLTKKGYEPIELQFCKVFA